ncbi:hypothetical protein SORBI_3002G101100 [Sorghum bicolor]|uniref:Uncharacterized protein n=1 Tax=Sorghum bicolor TaxID=4558 RepID=A0A1B6QA94_SORBI|nr:hypothetical protein SORBI_3002G101100 [Sorghum bicolor]OQU88823.1 hypothetical protein SORBI_3002G101100 [Sorghum bicolor]
MATALPPDGRLESTPMPDVGSPFNSLPQPHSTAGGKHNPDPPNARTFSSPSLLSVPASQPSRRNLRGPPRLQDETFGAVVGLAGARNQRQAWSHEASAVGTRVESVRDQQVIFYFSLLMHFRHLALLKYVHFF